MWRTQSPWPTMRAMRAMLLLPQDHTSSAAPDSRLLCHAETNAGHGANVLELASGTNACFAGRDALERPWRTRAYRTAESPRRTRHWTPSARPPFPAGALKLQGTRLRPLGWVCAGALAIAGPAAAAAAEQESATATEDQQDQQRWRLRGGSPKVPSLSLQAQRAQAPQWLQPRILPAKSARPTGPRPQWVGWLARCVVHPTPRGMAWRGVAWGAWRARLGGTHP